MDSHSGSQNDVPSHKQSVLTYCVIFHLMCRPLGSCADYQWSPWPSAGLNLGARGWAVLGVREL